MAAFHYLVQNNHEGIVSRDTYNAVQAEFARRSAGRAPTQKLSTTGRSCYSAKHALTERLVCGECGTLYRRCVWTQNGVKRPVWRCASRLDYGKKYCHGSPTLDEAPLQRSILAAINSTMSQRDVLVKQIEEVMWQELVPAPGETISLGDIDRKIEALNQEFQELFQKSKGGDFMKYAEDFTRINESMAALKSKRNALLEWQTNNSAANKRIGDAINTLNTGSADIIKWDESIIRQLVDTVKVISKDKIVVYLRGGVEVQQDMI